MLYLTPYIERFQQAWGILVSGDYDNAIDYLVNVGGIAKEKDYEYLGQDDFCGNPFMADTKRPSSSLVKVKVC